MGQPLRTLSKKNFSGSPLYHNIVRAEKCEWMHIHWRDMRILLSQAQFGIFSDMMKKSYQKWDGTLSPEEDVLLDSPTLPDGIAFDNIGLIEEQHGNLIHVHYGDLRLELQPQTFLMMARMFEQAKRKYNEIRMEMIDMELVDQYDAGHFETEEEWREYDKQHPGRTDDYQQHRVGIELVKQGLIRGRMMRPISVIKNEEDDKFKRLDGFKRYVAWKEVYGDGSKVPCYVESGNVTPGCQDGQPWFLESSAAYDDFNQVKGRVKSIRSLTGEVQAEWLFGLVKQTSNDALICELGTYYGFLSATMGLACAGSSRRLVVVDHMIGDHCEQEDRETLSVYKKFVDNMVLMGVWDKIIPLPFKSYNPNILDHAPLLDKNLESTTIRELHLGAYEMILAMGMKFDLIYLDANHDEANVYKELQLYANVLKVGGIIVGDDCVFGFMDMDWNAGDFSNAIKYGGPAAAVYRFFKGNKDFVPMKGVPGNQFGFKKVK